MEKQPLPLALRRYTGPEALKKHMYSKWAKQLTEGKPVRVETTHERFINFIPSASFDDNGGMPVGSMIVCYGSTIYRGYVELDFTKTLLSTMLMSKGFSMDLAGLICRTVYLMFPHLNPLTEADYKSLAEAGRKTPRATKNLRLTFKKTRNKKTKADQQLNVVTIPEVLKPKENGPLETRNVSPIPVEYNPTDSISVDTITPEKNGNTTKRKRTRKKADSAS